MLISSTVYDILNNVKMQCGRPKDVKQTVDNVMITCPHHKQGNENKPSCGVLTRTKKVVGSGKIVTSEEGTVHCFTCGYVATFPELISNLFGYNDGGKFGLEWLKKNYVSVEIENRKIDLDISRDIKDDLRIIGEDELKQYRYTHPYMYERGLTDKIIEHFDVGYDRKTKCLTFPVNNYKGECIFIQRRSVNSKFFKNEKLPKGETLYAIDKIYENIEKVDKVYIVESILDALTVWKYGGYAVSLLGLKLMPKQLRLLISLPKRRIVIATDNDKYGQEAKYQIKRQLSPYKMLYHFEYPDGVKDLNDMTKDQYDNLNLKFL